jgi:hypothetical protein
MRAAAAANEASGMRRPPRLLEVAELSGLLVQAKEKVQWALNKLKDIVDPEYDRGRRSAGLGLAVIWKKL